MKLGHGKHGRQEAVLVGVAHGDRGKLRQDPHEKKDQDRKGAQQEERPDNAAISDVRADSVSKRMPLLDDGAKGVGAGAPTTPLLAPSPPGNGGNRAGQSSRACENERPPAISSWMRATTGCRRPLSNSLAMMERASVDANAGIEHHGKNRQEGG